MRRKVLHAAIYWLTLSLVIAETGKIVKSSLVKDYDSAESAPRLYRNVPLGVYASAAPYAAFSFQVPTFIAPKADAAPLIPVRDQLLLQSTNGILRDSYGNRFVGTPQTAAYKTTFPQQFVQLQELPPHLAQPLLAVSPQAKQASPQFLGSHYRLPSFPFASSYGSSYGSSPQPYTHLGNTRNVPTITTQTQGIAAPQQLPSSNKAVYADSYTVEKFKNIRNSPEFQRLQYSKPENYKSEEQKISAESHEAQDERPQIQAAAAKTAITAIVNGQKTVINVDTKPPLPLLDLNLLEPLTFDNPLVPQVQHYLPRINAATYHKLSDVNVHQAKAPKKPIQKAKSYEGEIIKGKPHKDLKKKKPKQTSITLNGAPEIIYEINEPNHRETYKEQSISYNKETQSEPVNIAYNTKTQLEPVHYSYQKTEEKPPVTYSVVHSSNKAPLEVIQGPRQLIYTFQKETTNESQAKPDDAGSLEDSGSAEVQGSSEENSSSENNDSSEESHEEQPPHHIHKNVNQERQHKLPANAHIHDRPEHREQEYHHRPNGQNSQKANVEHHHGQNKQYHGQINHYSKPVEHHSYNQKQHHHNTNTVHHQRPKEVYHDRQHHISNDGQQQRSKEEYHSRPHHESIVIHHPISNEGRHHHSPQATYHPNLNEGHRHTTNEEYNPSIKLGHSSVIVHPQPNQIQKPIHPQYQQHIPQEYEEHIQIYNPPHSAAIQVDPGQNVVQTSPKPAQNGQTFAIGPTPIVHEKAKRIIIKEESPEEMHLHQEQITAEVADQEDNNEEDFEKAYKNAAFGFEAFEKKAEDIEKDIYNPASYGGPPKSFNIDASPFQQYQADGDTFPKSSRLQYKDARDNMKEDYYLEYAANKPESLSDRYRNKQNYYKLFKEQKPEKYFDDSQEQKKAKYISAPSFDFEPAPKQKSNEYFAAYKSEPVKYQYGFSKETPRDNSAHASRPYQNLKIKTYFVEPQFQYGFEPVALPRLLDSELAAMASNNSPESEKPGMRKKVYQENWYIKKTSTSGG